MGTHQAEKLVAGLPWNIELLEDLAFVMEQGSICGLGQAAPKVVQSLLRYFPELVS